MIDLAAYVLEPLHQDGVCLLYRGQLRGRSAGMVPSLLVVAPVGDHPAPASLRRLEHEYALRAELDHAWAVRPLALAQHQGRPVLVLADPGGEPLARLLGHPLALPQGVRLAIGLAAALGQLHGRGLIHKDIKPAHVFVNGATGQVWLMGFGIASPLPRERQAPAPPELIAGTLAYMAPEQTGRMNRSIDARSDLYALGVTLYELLTGTLPFTASEPLEWVHCHIARQPVPPAERATDVPPVISALVMKLLAKTAEERYQTAAGVEHDLRRCLAEWEARGAIATFPLGERDTPDRLLIPEKLYGRQREIETLLAAFDRVVKSGTPELVLVSGYSGIGKSSVVNELHKVLVPPRGLFASGKFDQYKRDIPYATLAQALQSLVRPLLGKSDPELAGWRDALQAALGPNARLIVDLVPEVKPITGEPPPVPELFPQDARRRFQLVFRRFIGVFARPEHPLALFLDDLQWLDTATLELIEDLLTQPDLRHLLLIGAYRNNEVSASHPLMRKLDAIHRSGAAVQEITLAPLVRDDLAQLIAEALRCDPARAAPLARLVHEKTGGNPFFAIQFLSALAEEELLVFDHAKEGWSWDLDHIHAKGYTDNVVELMVGKLGRLPVETQMALQKLACQRNNAGITPLSIVLGTSEEQGHAALWEAVRLELVERMDGSYKFSHDRVQEAAYSLIAEESRAETHLRIGRLLVAHTPREKRDERIFEIVNQLNRGVTLITEPGEREQLAELNLIAGTRAKVSTAYDSALTYLVTGATLLADDSWEYCHELAFALELNRAECEFLTGRLAAAEERLSMLPLRAANLVEKAAVAALRIALYLTLDRSDRGVEIGLEYLREVGIVWPPHPTDEEARREYDRIWAQLGNRTIEELMALPLMSDLASLATLDVLIRVVPAALFTDANLLSLTICRAVNLSLERGNSDGSCFAYAMLGRIAGPHFGNYEAGFRFGRLGYELVEQRGLRRFQAGTYMLFGASVLPWTRHVRAGRDLVRRAFEAAHKSGDLTFAAYSCNHLNSNMLAAGDPLGEVQREAEHGLEFAHKVRFGLVIDVITAQLGLIRTLRGLTPKFGSFDDEQFEELRMERRFSRNPNLARAECWYWMCKLRARFFAGDYATAIEAAARARRLLWKSPTLLETADYHLYGALARAAACDIAPADQRQQHVEALSAHHKQLQLWAENCPDNFANRAALVGAEIARLEGRELDAEHLYEQALQSARANGFVQNEALAYERAAAFYRARGFEQFADIYLRNARHCYLRWGADGKARQLDALYPHLGKEEPAPGPTGTIGVPVEHLDLATVLKVSQAVSGEIVLEKLLDTLMRTALEHAGAERGLLLLPRGDELRIAAEATTRGDTVIVHLAERPMATAALPETIVNYVVRTRDSVLLDDAAAPHAFAADAYLSAQHARSILCVPLLNQAKLTGVLYLENTLTPHVFTPTRRAVLTLLASQAAISLENARLYAERQRAEATVRRSEKQLRDVIETIPAIVWTALPDGANVFANRGWAAYTGRSAEDMAGAGWQTAVHPEDVERYVEAWHASLARGEPFEGEVRLRAADGAYRWFLARGRPLRDEQGQILRWYGVLTDIEDRKRAEEELRASEEALRNAQAELARVMRVLTVGELTASIAHEVNQPLTGVITNGQACLRWLARDDPNLEQARAAVHRIIRDGNRASQVITRIRALLQKGATQKGLVNLNHVIEDILALAQGELRRAGVSVQTAFAEHLPAVWADRVQLQQVVLNLIVNAIEAMTLVMDRPRRLHLRTAVDGQRILVTVRDTGVGMPPDVRDHMFETFYTTKPQGIGMGLAISHSIIQAHGGQLWAIPNDDHGATLLFTLPTGEEGRG